MGTDLKYEQKTPLGRAIKDLGIPIRTAAKLCGMGHKTMESYCKPLPRTGARRPSRDTFHHICKTLNLDEEELLKVTEIGGDQPNTYYLRPAQLLNMEDA